MPDTNGTCPTPERTGFAPVAWLQAGVACVSAAVQTPDVLENAPLSCVPGQPGFHGFPQPGTQDFCACVADIEQWFADIGNQAIDLIFTALAPEKEDRNYFGFILGILPGIFTSGVAGYGLRKIAEQMGVNVRAWLDQIKKTLVDATFCAPTKLMGLGLVKAMIGILRNTRFGTDAVIWLTVDINVSLAPLEHVVDYLLAHACPTEIPAINESIDLYLRNQITLPHCRCLVELRGGVWDIWSRFIEARRVRPFGIQLDVAKNRELYTDIEYGQALRDLGVTDSSERDVLNNLRFQVPGPSDLVRFAVRHVFEPDLIDEFGYNDEYRPILDAFHHAQGVDYPIFSGPLKQVVTRTEVANNFAPGTFLASYEEADLPEPTWARAYWWSHWILPSPGQGYEMMFRMQGEPGKPDTYTMVLTESEAKQMSGDQWERASDGTPRMKPFDLKHLQLLLRANDYPPYWRDKLTAIAYRPPNLRFLRVQIQTGTINHAQAVSQLRQMGFRPDYAENQATALERQIGAQEADRKWKELAKVLEPQWEEGLISDTEFTDLMRQANLHQNEAQFRLNLLDAGRQVRVARELVADIHKAFLRGAVQWSEADKFLAQIGVQTHRRSDYQVIWAAEKSVSHKELTAQQIINMAVDGLTDVASVAQTLRNLNYSDSAISLILADVRLRASEKRSKALRAMAAGQEHTQTLQREALSAARRMLREVQSDLARHGSPGKLKTWYCNGDIDAIDVTNRLKALSWPQEDIDRLLGECDAARAKIGLAPYAQEAPGSEA